MSDVRELIDRLRKLSMRTYADDSLALREAADALEASERELKSARSALVRIALEQPEKRVAPAFITEVIEKHGGKISTHALDCHEYHALCLAVKVKEWIEEEECQ